MIRTTDLHRVHYSHCDASFESLDHGPFVAHCTECDGMRIFMSDRRTTWAWAFVIAAACVAIVAVLIIGATPE